MAAGTRSLLLLDERNLLPADEPNLEEIGAELDSEAPEKCLRTCENRLSSEVFLIVGSIDYRTTEEF